MGCPFDKLRDRGGVLWDRWGIVGSGTAGGDAGAEHVEAQGAVLPSTGSGTARGGSGYVVIYLYKWVLIARVLIRNMGMWGVGASFGSLSYLADNKVVM